MKFGHVPVNNAVGAILAHSVNLEKNRLRKGEIITAAQCSLLLASGHTSVLVAQAETGDVHENEAAQIIAARLCGNNLKLGNAATGRCNVYAGTDGVVSFHSAAIDTLNHVDESITCATVQPYTRVHAGQLVATVKIIPFFAAQKFLERVPTDARITLHPFKSMHVRFIQTTLPHIKHAVYEKSEAITRARICHIHGGKISICPLAAHSVDTLAMLLSQPHDGPTLIMGATAITDREDVVPAAIVKAGGEIIRLGLPVDPGNLLCLGRLNDHIVIGLPGCARSPKLNGFDWVLDRLFAGLPLTTETCAAMGVGGLLDETPERPSPRRLADSVPSERPKKVGAILLAAGSSTRMGHDNKLLLDDGKGAMVLQTAQSLLASAISETFIVLGQDSEKISASVIDLALPMIYNPNHKFGMSTSIRAGLALAPADWDGALIMLADMPHIKPETFTALINAFKPEIGHDVIVPSYDGTRGNPIIWGRRHWSKFQDISGDVGGKMLLQGLESACVDITVDDAAILFDIDTPEVWAAMLKA